MIMPPAGETAESWIAKLTPKLLADVPAAQHF